MPELPEVETIVRQLNQVIRGKTVAQVRVFRKKSFRGNKKLLLGKLVTKTRRKAKVILIDFETDFPKLLIHLKMTGQLIFVDKDKQVAGGHPTLEWLAQHPVKHTRVEIKFKDGSSLFFNDMRVFGWVKVIGNQKSLDQELKEFSGIEPLASEFTVSSLASALSASSRPVKLVLMDQKKVAGVGNIYANDVLWDAGIDPRRPAKTLNTQEIRKLHESLNKIIELGIKYGGTSQSSYRQLLGEEGDYQYHFLVYKKEGSACQRCGTIIQKTKLGGRGTFYCQYCQK
ncbi:MAG: DNA-formamidopyrimidine glycosylase [Patescibacteria group bacterium]|jgi:formamidopyrimidine-DNA glycosylase